ncbi:MAG: DEAD/DEAH box helicase family protein [Christensenellaceae bacterium]|jgi:type III restriction enzyme|nr:DEAD/DEAH box helicase family protein [Christensenellaceae bacterium]
MKLKFKRQQFQDDAVKSVTDLFLGQDGKQSSFSIAKLHLEDYASGVLLGYGNRLSLPLELILTNMWAVQERNLLPLSELDSTSGHGPLRFNIEMETGTGKTFVYIKTIYELYRLYGFSKFVILVPSVAIREGVYKSFQITYDYFTEEYDGVKLNYFIYNSKRCQDVRDYALSPNLEVMIVNIDAIKKDENLFNQESDKMDKSAREYLAECRPILIIDEPQSVDGTAKSRDAINRLSPLCELRYSATHKEKVNTIYRLTPVDAYQMGIVKQICVANGNVIDDYNKPYIKLIETGVENGGRIFARLELDFKKKDGLIKRDTLKVYTNDILESKTGRDIYSSYQVSSINAMEGAEEIEFANTERLVLGAAFGVIDEILMKREQIQRTIETHFNTELRILDKGIKVLSLFFIDEVAKYRDYGKADLKGIYAEMFEECYNELINQPRFAKVKNFFNRDACEVHGGYFSKDKKGKLKDTKGDTSDDYDTYSAIMKDKEKLLSFDFPLRFIFSHSALNEGWDNPNVFQICTLIENRTVFTCRQKIGRGLRLCVDQTGERIDDRKMNVLNVIARESFSEFADTLQKEIEQETGVKFGILDIAMFVGLLYKDERGNDTIMTYQDSCELIEALRKNDYIDHNGKIKSTLKNDLEKGNVYLPTRFEKARERFLSIMRSADKKVEVRQTKERILIKRKDEVFEDPKFMEIWNRIKFKTYYRINIRIDELINRCVLDIMLMEPIQKAKLLRETAKISIEKSGVSAQKLWEGTENIEVISPLPDLVRILAENTGMPRTNIGRIILESNRIRDFINNSQMFIEKATKIINFNKNNMAIESIEYARIDGQEYSLATLFELKEESDVISYLDSVIKVDHSVYDYIIFDKSNVEKHFAEKLDSDPDVKLFFKIPDKFKISTPVGAYNPDWAVYMKKNGEQKLCFIIETKGSLDRSQLRQTEDIKIHCGKAHFDSLDQHVDFKLAKDWETIKRNV